MKTVNTTYCYACLFSMEAEGKEAPLLQRWFLIICITSRGFPGGASVKETASQCRRQRLEWDPWVRKIPWSRKWQHTPVFFPGKSMGRGAWRATVHGVVKRHTQAETPGEENGNPLQCSCLQYPTDRGAWWITVHGVAESQILLSS